MSFQFTHLVDFLINLERYDSSIGLFDLSIMIQEIGNMIIISEIYENELFVLLTCNHELLIRL